MTLTQLRYVIEVAEAGSISAAAARLFIAQPSLSKAVGELEAEMGVRIFERGARGVRPTDEGTRFLSYARQVVEQADLLESQYLHAEPRRRVFAVSSQHYAFVVNAFVGLVREIGREKYEFSLREGTTAGIIEDVCTFPRLTYDQGSQNSFYFSEELHSTQMVDKQIVVTDRATLFNLLIGLDGYTISSGVLSADLNGEDIVAVPLESDEHMEIGYLHAAGRPLSSVAERYVAHLRSYIAGL